MKTLVRKNLPVTVTYNGTDYKFLSALDRRGIVAEQKGFKVIRIRVNGKGTLNKTTLRLSYPNRADYYYIEKSFGGSQKQFD